MSYNVIQAKMKQTKIALKNRNIFYLNKFGNRNSVNLYGLWNYGRLVSCDFMIGIFIQNSEQKGSQSTTVTRTYLRKEKFLSFYHNII